MLNRQKLIQEIDKISDKIFTDISNELLIIEKTWQAIAADVDFKQRVEHTQTRLLIPTWQQQIDLFYKVEPLKRYTIIGVDGSQIYPDRHQGTMCFLLNTGSVIFTYGQPSFVQFNSEPSLFVLDKSIDDFNATDYVDARREQLELEEGLQLATLHAQEQPLLMLDGSLIFWHLVSKDKKFKDHFLKSYMKVYKQLYQQRLLYCSYTSLPKNKELINLIKLKLSDFNDDNSYWYSSLENLTDVHLMQLILEPFHRTIVFKNNASIAQEYEEAIAPYFFYMHVGTEIARIEIPNYIAMEEAKVNLIASITLDQVLKGLGYPVVLAESHEQAVVKQFDKEFFYELINKIGLTKKVFFAKSQKSIKKRKMAV